MNQKAQGLGQTDIAELDRIIAKCTTSDGINGYTHVKWWNITPEDVEALCSIKSRIAVTLDRIALAVEKITAIMTPILQKAGIEDVDFYEDTLKALNTASIGTEYTAPYSPIERSFIHKLLSEHNDG